MRIVWGVHVWEMYKNSFEMYEKRMTNVWELNEKSKSSIRFLCCWIWNCNSLLNCSLSSFLLCFAYRSCLRSWVSKWIYEFIVWSDLPIDSIETEHLLSINYISDDKSDKYFNKQIRNLFFFKEIRKFHVFII